VYAEIDGMPGLLRRIGGCESAGAPDAPINWTAQNRHSSASGGFQILDRTWRGWQQAYGGGGFVDTDGVVHVYSRALEAPPEYQLRVALGAFERQGTGPWRASRGCWG
jgi:muramidase (phage lysozyme)